MTEIEALILGVIQGLTEFLPVSSSGHLQIASSIFGTEANENLLFTILVHGATVLSTVVVFWKEIIKIIKGLFAFQWNDETKFTLNIAISIIPVGVVGVLFEKEIETFFNNQITFVAGMLSITAILLAATHFLKSRNNTGDINPTKAFTVGLAQAFAILPGISRSGATIATALILGVDKEKATRFSFLMVIVPILGATLLKAIDFVKTPASSTAISGLSLSIGFISAFLVGVVACKWMVSLVKKGKLLYFAIYCFAVSFFVLVYQII